MQPEPPTTANNSCHVSRDFVWLSGWGDEGDFIGREDWSRLSQPSGGEEVVVVFVMRFQVQYVEDGISVCWNVECICGGFRVCCGDCVWPSVW